MEMGQFLNEFATDTRVLVPVALASLAVLAVFSVLFDHWVGNLASEKKIGYSAILVALGNIVTLLMVAIISWKAAILVGLAFIASGFMVIIGDVNRSHNTRKQAVLVASKPRRKALPYAACGLIDDAIILLSNVEWGMRSVLEGKSDDRKIGLIALNVKEAIIKLTEARKIEG